MVWVLYICIGCISCGVSALPIQLFYCKQRYPYSTLLLAAASSSISWDWYLSSKLYIYCIYSVVYFSQEGDNCLNLAIKSEKLRESGKMYKVVDQLLKKGALSTIKDLVSRLLYLVKLNNTDVVM